MSENEEPKSFIPPVWLTKQMEVYLSKKTIWESFNFQPAKDYKPEPLTRKEKLRRKVRNFKD